MKAAYELRREFSESLEGHYKGGANDTGFSSGDARAGYMNGLKEGEKDASFGVEKVTFKRFSVDMTPLKKHIQAYFEDNNKTLPTSFHHVSYVSKK
jgi:hypothetical protein